MEDWMRQAHHVGFWFRRSDWDEVRAIVTDLHDTYDEWVNAARLQLLRRGLSEHQIEKVELRPRDLTALRDRLGHPVKSRDCMELALLIADDRRKKGAPR